MKNPYLVYLLDVTFAYCVLYTHSLLLAQEHCRISPSHFLAECQEMTESGSFVLLCFALFAFKSCICSCIFLYCFVCQYQSSDWLWRLPPKWPRLCHCHLGRWNMLQLQLWHTCTCNILTINLHVSRLAWLAWCSLVAWGNIFVGQNVVPDTCQRFHRMCLHTFID